MPTTCQCGMSLEAPSRRADCADCGRVCCPSCAIHVERSTYCRWCATAFLAI